MCGIAGILALKRDSKETLFRVCEQMTETLTHRGPDDSGIFVDDSGLIALGHRRLSILDLSMEGHQPMFSACGRYAMVYNGEVYNYRSIAAQLESRGIAPVFRGHSDTEVMLATISAWGLERAVESFVGMFAFALWGPAGACVAPRSGPAGNQAALLRMGKRFAALCLGAESIADPSGFSG
jgi:asparagine synthase (glutamine-hydrolysing)